MFDPRSDKTEGYHLFFEATGVASEVLAKTIGGLAAEYGGPIFAPHVTLLATIPEESEELLMQKARLLADRLLPFTLTLNGFGVEDRYFRALYMKVQNSAEVENYHRAARDIFGGTDEGMYLPHVSLLYGLYDTERKQESIASLQPLSLVSFEVSSLTLWHTPGATDVWKRIGEFPFGQQTSL